MHSFYRYLFILTARASHGLAFITISGQLNSGLEEMSEWAYNRETIHLSGALRIHW